ncbi:efflux RND transporter permease subunit [Persicimonas caeni]|uniref:Efflux RND transporter permease subunit n=1 Tax=Persicimonas caeni TaxID=2292766 RepID=A0A4Y6PQP6_PERCE|nr:CusA/CzcA family heavy metal efflux RND transporter [Persicimonas caeni]QDG50543.1 efflux RND transporter permease subunit [Persicimonas caeni]QED31764.1 efflux RND transporter permease subunit [Persicimonas caeni]
MIRRVIDWCVENPLMVVIATLIAVGVGIWSVKNTPLDAIPDLSENQVIVYTEWPGRGPQVIEDQVTYPLSANLQGIPEVKAIRATSYFGFSLVYVIFNDDADTYWARSRVLEKLNYAQSELPEAVTPTLGPDGTGVGHVYWYTLQTSEENPQNLAELRELQDYYIRYKLQSVEGVSEVASIGGFVKEYQVDLDPTKLEAYDVSAAQVAKAVQASNRDTGGKILEQSDVEYFVRGQGYFKDIEDIEQVVVKTSANGVPVTVRDLGFVQLGTEIRRGMLDENGEGEVVGGVVVMRYGENAKEVIERVEAKIDEIAPGLPEGVTIESAYDRSELIEQSVDTLTESLIEEAIVVSLIILLFLFHVRSSLVVVLTLPVAVLIAFIFMKQMGITSNIMSLGGIAIAVGVIVDASIVMVENAYRKLAEYAEEGGAPDEETRKQIIKDACKQVGPALFFSMLIIITSFVPVFMLTGQEGKLFTPLAWTKTLTMVGASVLAITLVPVLLVVFLKGKLRPEEDNPVSRFFVSLYTPMLRSVLKHPKSTILGALLLVSVTVPLVTGVGFDFKGDHAPEQIVEPIGSEFMPPLDEGSILYMPVTLPNVSVTEAKRLLQVTDKIIAEHPEVDYVLGKIGRAETATDPAPVSMIETIVILKPEDEWRDGVTKDDIISELDQKLQIPGMSNGWTQPIINRINMLATGIRTDIGVKFFGPDLDKLGDLALEAEQILREVPGAADLYAERVTGGHYVNITPRREDIARYGLTVEDVNRVTEIAIGGMPVTDTVEGRSRFPVRVRYARDYRSSVDKLEGVLLTTPSGQQIPLGQVADVEFDDGPPMINSENGDLRSVVLLNVRGRDMGGFIKEAEEALEENLEMPPGYSYTWSGQYENQKRANERLSYLIPLAVLIIFMFLYFTFRNVGESLVVMLSVPFALVGGVWLLYLMDLNFSVAVWVGFIALFGVAVETGVVMLVYLHEALDERLSRRLRGAGLDPREADGEQVARVMGPEDVHGAAVEGAALRLRPKLMTAATTLLGLTPLLWATGTGSDVMKPIAVPMVGGMVSSVLLVLFVIPVIFDLMKRRALRKKKLTYSALSHG